jgi:uncharacterized protein YndB with AHSA1/START domain
MNTNQIQKKIVLNAPVERVWQAVSDSSRFGAWFGVKFEGPFVAGSTMTGSIVPTQVDPEVAKLQEPHAGKRFEIIVEDIKPMRQFSFRWHPFAIDPDYDYSKEPTTLVTFEVSPGESGTVLTITESGFEQIPQHRREQAFKANDGGWSHQSQLIAKYLAGKFAEVEP